VSAQRHILQDAPAAAQACAKYILGVLEEARAARGQATMALSGGSTPKLLFHQMAASNFPWDGIHFFWVDERPVPPDDDRSNYKLAAGALLSPAAIPPQQVHRIRAELDPTVAADMYVEEIRNFFKLQPNELPRFDVIHRGMGAEGHTASLFPGEPLIGDRQRIAGPVRVEKLSQWRITLLPGVLLAARHTAMLVAGEDKATAVRAVFEDPYDPLKYPAQLGLRDAQEVEWFLDEPAGRLLPRGTC
jgi:6-phosphogluconolactonase